MKKAMITGLIALASATFGFGLSQAGGGSAPAAVSNTGTVDRSDSDGFVLLQDSGEGSGEDSREGSGEGSGEGRDCPHKDGRGSSDGGSGSSFDEGSSLDQV